MYDKTKQIIKKSCPTLPIPYTYAAMPVCSSVRYRHRRDEEKKVKFGLEDDDLRIPMLRVYVDVCVRICVVCLVFKGDWRDEG